MATLIEKILRRNTGISDAKPGDIVTVRVDRVMVHDIFIPFVADKFEEMGFTEIWDPDKMVLIYDHLVPTTQVDDTRHLRRGNEFAKKYELTHVHQSDGVCHQLMPEQGYVKPGDVVFGTDSHTVTYGATGAFSTGIGYTEMAGILGTGELWIRVPETIRVNIEGELPDNVSSKDVILTVIGDISASGATYQSLEFAGSTIRNMSVASRLTISNMTVEAGAKCGLCYADEKTIAFTGADPDSDGIFADDYEDAFDEVFRTVLSDRSVARGGCAGVSSNRVKTGIDNPGMSDAASYNVSENTAEIAGSAEDVRTAESMEPTESTESLRKMRDRLNAYTEAMRENVPGMEEHLPGTPGFLRTETGSRCYESDPKGTGFARVLNYRAEDFVPVMACPSYVDCVRPVEQEKGIRIDQVFIGSCTNGRLEDLHAAAEVLSGNHVAPFVKLIVTPASRTIYRQALTDGTLKALSEAGAMITTPGCGLCCGRAGGILTDDEVVVATNNRNFLGRMGTSKVRIYLASPRTAAACAIAGEIRVPE